MIWYEGNDCIVRTATEDDVVLIAQLEQVIWGQLGTPVYDEQYVSTWRRTHPEGLLIAQVPDTLEAVGYGHSQRINFSMENLDVLQTSELDTDGGTSVGTHRPSGNALYSMAYGSVRKGVGSALFQATLQQLRHFDIEYFVGFSRIPGFNDYLRELWEKEVVVDVDEAVHAYVARCAIMVQGKMWPTFYCPDDLLRCYPDPSKLDPTLGFYLKQKNFGVVKVYGNYCVDPSSHNFGILMAYHNSPSS